ncbi:MAG: hypothetical protein H6895_04360 [Defluviimonas sp.]|nr:hypothetical protein [Paracoccaceae bacterium]MCC0063307.1 hypothetical protein [Defluviimonas sp.]
MNLLKSTLVAAVISLGTAPAMAGGIVFDFPTLTWPKPAPEVTRGCIAAPAKPATGKSAPAGPETCADRQK